MTTRSRPRHPAGGDRSPSPTIAPIVTICGSMRFYDLMLTVAADQTRAGSIVLMPFAVVAPDEQHSDMKAMLDRLHREKIEMSDRVIVVTDQTGYYGTSTTGEIEHAQRWGLPVDYWRVTAQHDHADVAEPTLQIEPDGLCTVPCWFGCGYLAASEAELNSHEADCERADQLESTFYASTEEFLAGLELDAVRAAGTPAPRSTRSVGRRDHRGGAQQ